MQTLTPSTQAIRALGDLLEMAQERLDDSLHLLPEDDASREMQALDELWSLYQALLAQA